MDVATGRLGGGGPTSTRLRLRERVFSQVSIIIGSIGENVLEETLECRVMERVNKY